MEFFEWMKKILLENEINKVKEELKSLKSKGLNIDPKTIEEISNNQFYDDKKINVKSELGKFYSQFKENIYSIYNIQDKYYNKTKKHKILYFLYGFSIYLRKKLVLDELNIFSSIKNKNLEWVAFENGPVLNSIYNWNKTDIPIEINLDIMKKWNLEDLFKIAILKLNFFPLEQLIYRSHETDPWKNVSKTRYYSKIENKKIIEYFEKNAPFFIKE